MNDFHEDVALFLMDGMNLLGTDAVNIGELDLKYGLSFLLENARAKKLPLISANLQYAGSGKLVATPYVIKKVGNVTVGTFGLITEKGNLGISADSLKVEEPTLAADRVVKELRGKGVDVVVLLSQLGKVESEDLVAAIDGIDAVMIGRNVPLLQQGRMIKNTVACYGGEQGQNVGRTLLQLDAKRRVTTGTNEVFRLGPEIPDKPEVLALVTAFEEGFNEKMRKVEATQDAERAAAAADDSPTRFLGAELCARCHSDEFEQWKTTSHSVAWQTLVDAKKDATPDCIPCHVVGFQQPGGFKGHLSTPDRVNVQCENCHGMGSEHHVFTEAEHHVAEATCVQCHQGENDPEWNWEKKRPKIVHSNYSGETIKSKKTGKLGMMGGH